MRVKLLSASALLVACTLASGAGAQTSSGPAQYSTGCEVHLYPAAGVHSVGEDFDAVHQVDQDLRHYNETAGRSLDWLTPDRQLALLGEMRLGELVGVTEGSTFAQAEPLSRRQALEPGPRQPSTGCRVEIMLPQIMLERGGLATRSLRLFGVIRRFENARLVRGYSGFAAAPMTGFQLKTTADAAAATAVVEQAYRSAVEIMLRNFARPPRK